MRNALGLMTLIGLAFGASVVPTAARAEDEARARKMMEDAFNRRYRWGEDFQGFSADFTYTREGEVVKGSLRVDVTKPHGGIEVTSDEAVKNRVQETNVRVVCGSCCGLGQRSPSVTLHT